MPSATTEAMDAMQQQDKKPHGTVRQGGQPLASFISYRGGIGCQPGWPGKQSLGIACAKSPLSDATMRSNSLMPLVP